MHSINRINKVLQKYSVELTDSVTAGVEFVSKIDLKKIIRIDNTLLNEVTIPDIGGVVRIKEEIYADILINVKGENVFVCLEGIYIPVSLSCKQFNFIIGIYCKYPNYFYKTKVNNEEYLYYWWDKLV